MPLATLKDKGQITLPADIRRKIHADKGDIFNFEVTGDKVIMTLQKLVPSKGTEHKKTASGVDISRYIGSMNGNFGEIKEIDDYIRNERGSWES